MNYLNRDFNFWKTFLSKLKGLIFYKTMKIIKESILFLKKKKKLL